ncbi:carbon storage regulator [Roseimaritima ulvae]|uniref:Carbon storage regulator n=1 Tax=Roseimaritima ulvae TaxID=980254 RepID=A0A5B9QU54_9BACT|nr:carbon storage regulator [Roseimaritima ulvae]QEG42568.1 carbon storage regulator [Roseimaritima ulvae]
MLVLSRKPQETIQFPDLSISVHVLRCSGHQAQIGIDAPRAIRVLRGELQPEELRPLPVETQTGSLLAQLQRLESQVSALTELSAASDRPLATAVAEEAQESLYRLRRQILLSGKRLDPTPTPLPASVHQATVGYQVDALLPSA